MWSVLGRGELWVGDSIGVIASSGGGRIGAVIDSHCLVRVVVSGLPVADETARHPPPAGAVFVWVGLVRSAFEWM